MLKIAGINPIYSNDQILEIDKVGITLENNDKKGEDVTLSIIIREKGGQELLTQDFDLFIGAGKINEFIIPLEVPVSGNMPCEMKSNAIVQGKIAAESDWIDLIEGEASKDASVATTPYEKPSEFETNEDTETEFDEEAKKKELEAGIEGDLAAEEDTETEIAPTPVQTGKKDIPPPPENMTSSWGILIEEGANQVFETRVESDIIPQSTEVVPGEEKDEILDGMAEELSAKKKEKEEKGKEKEKSVKTSAPKEVQEKKSAQAAAEKKEPPPGPAAPPVQEKKAAPPVEITLEGQKKTPAPVPAAPPVKKETPFDPDYIPPKTPPVKTFEELLKQHRDEEELKATEEKTLTEVPEPEKVVPPKKKKTSPFIAIVIILAVAGGGFAVIKKFVKFPPSKIEKNNGEKDKPDKKEPVKDVGDMDLDDLMKTDKDEKVDSILSIVSKKTVLETEPLGDEELMAIENIISENNGTFIQAGDKYKATFTFEDEKKAKEVKKSIEQKNIKVTLKQE